MNDYDDYDDQDANLCDSFGLDGCVESADPEGSSDWNDVLEDDDNI